jgi:hypothetical protein
MMMPYDSGQTPPGRLEDATIDAVRSALRGYAESGEPSDGLRIALMTMATEARDKSILPEQLLVVLKGLWSALPEVRAMTDASKQIQLQQRVVTMCIREYYSS